MTEALEGFFSMRLGRASFFRTIVCTATLALGACGIVDPSSSPTIRGAYALASVGGQSLPCCAQKDSTGTLVTLVGGSLVLGDAGPEPFVATPAGYHPSSCVHEVPNGTVVNASTFPPCGDGSYTLLTIQRRDFPDGTSRTDSTTSAGLYAWTDRDPHLVEFGGLMGGIASSSRGISLSMQQATIMGEIGPVYLYSLTR